MHMAKSYNGPLTGPPILQLYSQEKFINAPCTQVPGPWQRRIGHDVVEAICQRAFGMGRFSQDLNPGFSGEQEISPRRGGVKVHPRAFGKILGWICTLGYD
jgi:hypothetical protein